MNSIGCTLLLIQKRTICSIHSLNQRLITLSQIDFSLIPVTNTTSMTQLFSPRGFQNKTQQHYLTSRSTSAR